MTWRETDQMNERLKFIAACLEGDETMVDLCAQYGVSRKTGYKWLGRYEELGAEGLHDRPRAPLEHGRATARDLVERIIAAKEDHLQWGPKKIVAWLGRKYPEEAWPVASTAGEILKRHGLVKGRRRARWKACGNGPWPPAHEPNAVWTADHKGWFRTGDGRRCEPLTVMDARSRYLLALEAVSSTSENEAWPVFERLFEEFGLPDRLRSDNGAPFASAGVAGLTPLALRFVKLGIGLERITPGKPQQNGAHERFHLTLLPLAQSPQSERQRQQEAFEIFRTEYNQERPHEALEQTPPATHYTKSRRAMPRQTPQPDYPSEATVRRVRHNGEIKWGGAFIYVSQTLAGEQVAIEEADNGEWTVRIYAHPLGIIDTRHMRLRRRSTLPLKGQGAAAQITPEL